MARRLEKTLADYMVIAISPALIMTLVGSLVFFLMEITYRGQHAGRLRWVLFWFVFAAVLTARIAIQEGKAQAAAYTLGMSFAAGLFIWTYIDAPVVGWALLAVVWWCTSKLTYDCTLIDDEQDASGEGLLRVARMESASGQPSEGADAAEASAKTKKPADGFWQRWFLNREDPGAKPHSPGLWVVYFSLAALPLFGIGQLMIDKEDAAARRWGFGLLWVYVASALALLLTTSFLGLRRYLRQRNLSMPGSMAASWLGTGVAMIVVLLLISMFFPRPDSTYSLTGLVDKIGSAAQRASDRALLKQDGGEGPGAESSAQGNQQGQPGGDGQPQRDGAGQPKAAGQGEGDQKDGDPQNPGQNGPQGESQGQGDKGESQDGKSQDGKQGQDGKSQDGKSSGRGPGKQANNRGQQGGKQDDRSKQPGAQGNQQAAGNQNQQNRGNAGRQGQQRGEQPNRNARPSQPPRTPSTPNMGWVGSLVKWLIYGLLALVVLFVLIRYSDRILAFFKAVWLELQRLWQSLFGGGSETASGEVGAPVAPIVRRRPFAEYPNPFATGAASRMQPGELVRYTFEALEAWAGDQGRPRPADQTPHEFTDALGLHYPRMKREASSVVDLYGQWAYAGRVPPQASLPDVERLWRRMSEHAYRVLEPAMASDAEA